MKLLSFVIPCYRSEKTIENVINEIIDVVEKKSYDYEIICVNDFSPDNVYTVLKKIAENNKRVKVLNLSKNQGKHAAVLAGYAFVKGDYIVNIDDDGQCPIDRLWDLLLPVESDDYDIATAEYMKKKQALWKNIGSNINSFVGSLMLEKPRKLRMENFSIVKRYVVDEMVKYPNPYPYLEGLMLRITNKISAIKMEERGRVDDNSTGFTFKKSLKLFFDGFTAFSVKPLRVATIIGAISAVVGLVWAIVVFFKKVLGIISMPGYTSIVIIQLIMNGLLLIGLGIIGEYIGRMYICMNKSPQYVIKELINIKNE